MGPVERSAARGGVAGRAAGAAETAAEGAGGAGAAGAVGHVVNGGPGVAGAIEAAPEIVAPAGLAAVSAVVAGGMVYGLTDIIKQRNEAQEPGRGGLWAPVTADSRASDENDIAGLRAERDQLNGEIARARAMEKIPGFSDVPNFARQQRVDDLDRAIALKERSIVDLDAPNSHEARVGRAMMAMKAPEEAGPGVPKDWSWKYGRVMGSEEFGPAMPPLHVEPGYPGVEQRSFGSYLHRMAPIAAAGGMPMATPPGGVVPVQIVGGTPPTASAAPPRAFDSYLDGDRPGIEERSRRGAAMFREDHEGTVGRHMMEHEDVSPHVDDSAIVALDTKLTELGQHAQAVGATPISIKADAGSIENMIALLTRAIGLKAQLGGMPAGGAGGTSGSVGTSYAATGPAGRQGGPR